MKSLDANAKNHMEGHRAHPTNSARAGTQYFNRCVLYCTWHPSFLSSIEKCIFVKSQELSRLINLQWMGIKLHIFVLKYRGLNYNNLVNIPSGTFGELYHLLYL